MAGWGLTEALVAVGVLSLGVLGLLWQQGKTAVAWRSQYMAEQAAWLAQDMAERMRVNRGQLDAYRLGWGQVPNAVDCSARPCSRGDCPVGVLSATMPSPSGEPDCKEAARLQLPARFPVLPLP